MKKFLIFLVSIIVVVSIGLTTFYFLRNDEVIDFETKEIYCNLGDQITLEDLGYTRHKAHKRTTFNFNAASEEDLSKISYNPENGYYEVIGTSGGEVSIVITTSNKKYPSFKVNVHVGDGTALNPYYVFNASFLSKIGGDDERYSLAHSYALQNDIILPSNFAPIGSQSDIGFTGNFNGNGYTISGLNVNGDEYDNAGLFTIVAAGASVRNLTIKDASVNGAYSNAGILAGVVNGTVEKVAILNSAAKTTKDGGKVAALAGTYSGSSLIKTYAENVTVTGAANSEIGGLVGELNFTTVQACYANTTIEAGVNSVAGGFVGKFNVNSENGGSIQQSYACANADASVASFIGKITTGTGVDQLKVLVGNAAVIGDGQEVVNDYDTELFNGVKNPFTNGYNTVSPFYTVNHNYMIVPYAKADLIAATDVVFYSYVIEVDVNNGEEVPAGAISSVLDAEENIYGVVNNIYWDSNVWEIASNDLPRLRDNNVKPASVDPAYFAKNVNTSRIRTYQDLVDIRGQEGKKIKLMNDITLGADWTSVDLEGWVINGNGKTINCANINDAVFGSVTNSSISNLKLINAGLDSLGKNGSLGSLADNVSASTIDTVSVTYSREVNAKAEVFGGLVGKIEKSTIVVNSSVSGLVMSSESTSKYVGGLVGTENGYNAIVYSRVNANLTATDDIGGVVSGNNGLVQNVSGAVTISSTNEIDAGGIAARNNGVIGDSTMFVQISGGNNSWLAGVAAINDGTIQDVVITGSGISATADAGKIAGVSVLNNARISNVEVEMLTIGSYNEGKNYEVAGVVVENAGSVSKVLINANVRGNVVAGVVVRMNSADATIDQVYIGHVATSDTKIEISGDKYVAGVAVDFRLGTISNIQTVATINGRTNDTRSSLIVLVFPDGAVLKNAVIDNTFAGSGIFYRETWVDFANFSNKSEFGFSDVEKDARFNLYDVKEAAGLMTSVVINDEAMRAEGITNVRVSEFAYPVFFKRYEAYEEQSFFKTVNNGDFHNADTYKTACEFKAPSGGIFFKKTYKKDMTFEIGSTWTEGEGITLTFVK